MKRFWAMCFLLVLWGCAGLAVGASPGWAAVAINEVNFPDENFRNYISGIDLYSINPDTDHDGILSDEEIANVKGISVGRGGYFRISNLKGIEYFTALEYLDCSSNNLTELDLSKNTALTYLACGSNELTELDLSNNRALTYLDCDNNKLTALDLSRNTALMELHCGHNNFTELDLSSNTALVSLDCSHNSGREHPMLTKLDVSKCTALEYLSCYNNDFGELDLRGCPVLRVLICSYSNLNKLDLSNNKVLTKLDCQENNLTVLDLSNNTALTDFGCNDNKLALLDVTGCTALKNLYCYHNKLTTLDVSECRALMYLGCTDNNLIVLDVDNNAALQALYCDENSLTMLDLSKNTALTRHDLTGYFSIQTRTPLKVTQTALTYQVNLADYMPVDKVINVDRASIEATTRSGATIYPTGFNTSTGVIMFADHPVRVSYKYDTCWNGRGNILMNVVIEAGLAEVAALERGRGADNIICDISENAYLNAKGAPLTEDDIASYSPDTHGKSGFTADGNTRLILRAQTRNAGTVTFSVPAGYGTFEGIDRKGKGQGLIRIQIPTTPISGGLHQASAVLIAPKVYPMPANNLPATFNVNMTFKAGESEPETLAPLPLTVHATPVVLIHGIFGESGSTFGVGKKKGVWHKLNEAGFPIYYWNYDGTKGPLDILSGNWNSLFQTVSQIFEDYRAKNIACTKVDLVVHSMGGLMARRFTRPDTEGNDGNYFTVRSYKQGMARRIVTLATPHNGSPIANYMRGDHSALNINAWDVATDPDRAKATALLIAGKPLVKSLVETFIGSPGKDANSAWRDLAIGSAMTKQDLSFSVPMYAIYGKTKDDITLLKTTIDVTVKVAKFADLLIVDPTVSKALKVLQAAGTAISTLLDVWNEVLFSGEDHDLCVSESSAHGNFSGYSQGYRGLLKYCHISICNQDDVGEKVVDLLEGPEKAFKTSNATGTWSVRTNAATPAVRTGQRKVVASAEDEIDLERHFITRYNLTAMPSTLTGAGTMVLTGTADGPFEHDAYMIIETAQGDKLFKVANVGDDGFSVTLEFSEEDAGVMSASYFSQGNEENVYVSNNVQLTVKPDSSGVTGLSFPGGIDTIFTNVSSDIPIGLYAAASDGSMYDVSTPAMGTTWTAADPTIATVTEAGRVRGLAEGLTALTATYNGLTATISVDVGPAYETAQPPDDKDDTPPDDGDDTPPDGDDESKKDGKTTSGGGGGGCSAGFGALAMAALAAYALRRRA